MSPTPESRTAELIGMIRSKPITPEDLVSASHFVLDTIACVIGGQVMPPGRILLDWFERGGGAGRDAFLASGLAPFSRSTICTEIR